MESDFLCDTRQPSLEPGDEHNPPTQGHCNILGSQVPRPSTGSPQDDSLINYLGTLTSYGSDEDIKTAYTADGGGGDTGCLAPVDAASDRHIINGRTPLAQETTIKETPSSLRHTSDSYPMDPIYWRPNDAGGRRGRASEEFVHKDEQICPSQRAFRQEQMMQIWACNYAIDEFKVKVSQNVSIESQLAPTQRLTSSRHLWTTTVCLLPPPSSGQLQPFTIVRESGVG